jgi:hypothetical protein
MDNANWEIGVSAENLEELLSGEQAGMNLWFLAGYVKGISDSQALQVGERRLVFEPSGDNSWRLSCSAAELEA